MHRLVPYFGIFWCRHIFATLAQIDFNISKGILFDQNLQNSVNQRWLRGLKKIRCRNLSLKQVTVVAVGFENALGFRS